MIISDSTSAAVLTVAITAIEDGTFRTRINEKVGKMQILVSA
jgi:hypothetical protein